MWGIVSWPIQGASRHACANWRFLSSKPSNFSLPSNQIISISCNPKKKPMIVPVHLYDYFLNSLLFSFFFFFSFLSLSPSSSLIVCSCISTCHARNHIPYSISITPYKGNSRSATSVVVYNTSTAFAIRRQVGQFTSPIHQDFLCLPAI